MKTFLVSTNYIKGNSSCMVATGGRGLKTLDDLQNCGGFRRFNMEAYSDRKEPQALSLKAFKRWLDSELNPKDNSNYSLWKTSY